MMFTFVNKIFNLKFITKGLPTREDPRGGGSMFWKIEILVFAVVRLSVHTNLEFFQDYVIPNDQN